MQEDSLDTSKQEQPTPTSDSNWAYTSDEKQADTVSDVKPVTWTASEFVAHPKTAGWFLLLGLGAVALAAAIYLLSHDIISPIFIGIMAVTFGVFANRQPRVLEYTVDKYGIHIGEKLYTYPTLRSFSLVDEGAFHSILLSPMQRFMPPLSIYYAPEDEEKITQALGNYLPQENRSHDAIDRLMKKVRF
jgi:hypothetical protein